jgi:type II secretory pathway component PulF
MGLFEYRVRDRSGAAFAGSLECGSRAEAVGRLNGMGYSILELSEQAHGPLQVLRELTARFSIAKARTHATRQLASLTRAGVPIVKALESIARGGENPIVAKALREVRDTVKRGESLAGALERNPQVFPQVYTSLIAAGESSGTLEQILARLAKLGERELALRGRVQSALAYPALLVLFTGGVVSLLFIKVLPRFVTVFESVGADLPPLTKLMFALSAFAAQTWWLAPIMVVGLALVAKQWLATPGAGERLDALVLRVPVVGAAVRLTVTAAVARTLATLVQSGLPIVRALELVIETTANRVFTRALRTAVERVSGGGGIAEALEETRAFPELMTSMVATGEESGTLPEMLQNTADLYDEEVENKIGALMTLIEPMLLIVLGGVVLTVALSVLLPMFNLIQMYQS